MTIKNEGFIEKSAKLSEGEVEVVVSTDDWDAYGERILPNGIDFKSYLKGNNVVLWGHDGFNLPIGNATKVWVDGNKLMARVKFYLKDEFPRKVYQYVLDNVVKAVSIGGQVEEWGEDGVTIAKMIMKEFSFVSIPANEKALVTMKSLTTDQQTEFRSLAKMYARKMLSKTDGIPGIRQQIDTLKSLVTTLEEVANVGETYGETVDDSNITRRVVLRSAQAVDQQVETVIRSIKLKGNS